MSKLISNPTECGYNNEVCGKHFCDHPSCKLRHCTWTKEFPTACPLQDGFTRLDLLAVVKTAPIMNKIESDIINDLLKPKKRRNRKDCEYGYYVNVVNLKHLLHCKHKSISYPHCQGVNCGHFKTKQS